MVNRSGKETESQHSFMTHEMAWPAGLTVLILLYCYEALLSEGIGHPLRQCKSTFKCEFEFLTNETISRTITGPFNPDHMLIMVFGCHFEAAVRYWWPLS